VLLLAAASTPSGHFRRVVHVSLERRPAAQLVPGSGNPNSLFPSPQRQGRLHHEPNCAASRQLPALNSATATKPRPANVSTINSAVGSFALTIVRKTRGRVLGRTESAQGRDRAAQAPRHLRIVQDAWSCQTTFVGSSRTSGVAFQSVGVAVFSAVEACS
jgi:hypothetical protein